MPIAVIHILEGREKTKKELLIKKVSKSICESLEVPEERVRVIINEMKSENFGIAGLPVDQYRQKIAKK